MNWKTGTHGKNRVVGIALALAPWNSAPGWRHYQSAYSTGRTVLLIAPGSVSARDFPDPELPLAAANREGLPAGSLVLPLDHTYASRVAPFNFTAHSLVNSRPVFVSQLVRCEEPHDESSWEN